MYKIFLSYSSKDRIFVNKLARDLKVLGFEVWYDQWELSIGDSIMDKVQDGIQSSAWLAIILSPESVKSNWVKQELGSAWAKQLADERIFILPILYKDCEIPAFLADKVYVDFRKD